jgi:hypothetical protein
VDLDDALLTKLTLEAYSDQACSTRVPGLLPWKALFNPTELSFSRKNTYSVTPAQGTSLPQVVYTSGEACQMSLDLIFDGTGVVQSRQTVGERIDALLNLGAFQGETHQPYYLKAYWGPYSFRGALTQIDVTYTLFDRFGKPLRAKVKLGLLETVTPKEAEAREKKQSPDLYQTWLVEQGQRLEHIAAAVYGDAAYWRPLAEANALRNPRALTAGQTLVLPPLATSTA